MIYFGKTAKRKTQKKARCKTMNKNYIVPSFKDGRVFISPVIGCCGGCKYCYLKLRNLTAPKLNCLSIEKILALITENKEFIAGKNGTIISMGAWGDIFQTDRFIDMSINLIIELIKLGNPIQFMSKYKLDISLISKLAKYVQYTNQVLYSTTITTIDKWKTIEPNTVSPEERIKTCKEFKNQGIESNVLIKPFIPGTTDLELDKIIYLLKEYNITYCVIGKLYISDDILKSLGKDCLINADALELSTLDCNGNIKIQATQVKTLYKYIEKFRENGINAFFKSSCVNSNINKTNNPSNYYFNNDEYCINCGNCK